VPGAGLYLTQNTMLEIEIDGRKLEVPDGSTVMDAAHQANIYIPHFCYHEKLSIAANCRMCLVQVEKAPKPLPACATPVTNGMKVQTHSDQAVIAQKGVMEFLLINHPLDCPICDQGGECQLQDLAVGYGGSGSRYAEPKRVVNNKDLGPLISTDMTRCIHCTRCVRFGQEIAGVMELGVIGRGEHSEIIAFVGKTVDSELSGNSIDLCPVGALTSKPFRYSARSWELTRRPSISPHCGLGANLTVQVKQNRVMRVLPRENDAVNECWLSDKDRFAYEGLNAADRLVKPMIRQDGKWLEVDWQVALAFVAKGLQGVKERHGAAQIGALATPHQTVEELYLLQKLMRGIGSQNVDFRLRQTDFSADAVACGAPWLGMAVADIAKLDRVLVVGSTFRKDHPLIALRLRQAARRQLQLNLINPVDDDLLMNVANRAIVAPSRMVPALAAVVRAVAQAKSVAVPAGVPMAEIDAGARAIAENLATGKQVALWLGNLARHHPAAAQLHMLLQQLADLLGATFGFLGEAANSVGGHLAGALPGDGLNAAAMLAQPRRGYLLLGVEPEFDCADPAQAMQAMKGAEFVVALSPYQHGALDYAHALLPIAPFSETSGTFVSTEGRAQGFGGVVLPLAETRPAWKVLRVLGNLLGVSGFDFEGSDDVMRQVLAMGEIASRLDNRLSGAPAAAQDRNDASGVERIGEVPTYRADAIVRRAPSLQKTRDGSSLAAAVNQAMWDRLGLRAGDQIGVSQGGPSVILDAVLDPKLPDQCVRVPAATQATAVLGAALGRVTVERVAGQRQAAV
jgi:NADH-quinone oxidoreductase subunit G